MIHSPPIAAPPPPDSLDAAGLGDITQSFFFSPKESSFTWGIGPVLLIPTARGSVSSHEDR